MTPGDKLLSTDEVLELVPVSRSKLEHDRTAGRIGYYRLGRRSYYSAEDVGEYLESHRRKRQADPPTPEPTRVESA